MIKKLLLLASLPFSIFTLSYSSWAVEYQSPRTLSLGGAGRATPFLNDAIYLNPSYASFAPIYSLAAGYTWFNQGRNYNVSVQDSRTEMFQAGVGYTKREQNTAISIGASHKVIDALSAGLGTKIILDNVTNNSTFDFIFSTTYIALPWMYASIIVDNLLESDQSKARNLYRTFFLGTKFIPTKEVLIYVDPLYSPSYNLGKKIGYSAGLELSVLTDFYLRGGIFHDAEVTYANTRGQGIAWGVGYLGPKIHLDYALHRMLVSNNSSGITTANSAEMTIFF